tara:strand:+ start:169 stop:381 length:213 start_codon:yes stop_codon:yes gene_type:complete
MGGHLRQFSLVMALTAGVGFCPGLLQLLASPIDDSLSIGVRGDLSYFNLMMPLLALMFAGPGPGDGISTA